MDSNFREQHAAGGDAHFRLSTNLLRARNGILKDARIEERDALKE